MTGSANPKHRIRQAVDFMNADRASRHPFRAIPADCAPRTVDEAYAMQDSYCHLQEPAHGPVVGYKIALTTPVMQQMLNFPEPLSGQIHANRVYETGADIRSSDYMHLGVECEIAVRLGSTLPEAPRAPFTRSQVSDAVESIMVALELIDDRCADYTQLNGLVLSGLVDNGWSVGLVLGQPLENWRMLDLAAVRGTLSINDRVAGEGYGRDVLGHPLDALTWLANNLVHRGRTLEAGTIVTTGSIVATQFVTAGDYVHARVEGVGEVRINIV